MSNNIIDAAPTPEPSPKRPQAGRFPATGHRVDFMTLHPQGIRRGSAPAPMQSLDFERLPEFFRRDDPYRLHPQVVQSLREKLRCEIGPLSLPALDSFLQSFFKDDLVVESYACTLMLDGAVGQAFAKAGRPLRANAWREAQRAGIKASRSQLLGEYPQEQDFVKVAAWALPAGLFVLCHPSVQAKGEVLQHLKQARELTTDLVYDAIRAMHAVSATQARVMDALIGRGENEDCSPRQLSRLATALYLSQSHINERWVPASGWTPRGEGGAPGSSARG